MNRTEFPFVRRAAGAQNRLLRGNWGLDYELYRDAYRAACGVEVSPVIDAFARCPELHELQLKAEAQIDRAGGEFCLSFLISASAKLRIGDVETSIDTLEGALDAKETERLWRLATPGADRAHFDQAIARINDEIRIFQAEYNIRHGEVFWGKHHDFKVTRDMVEPAVVGDIIDYACALNAILGWGEPVAHSFDRPPHRWSPVTLSRIDKFLAAGVSPDACDDFGVTPLNAAVAYGRHPWVHPLMRAGADLELCDVTGMNPVSTAAGKGDFGMVEVLVRAGANPDGSRFAPSLVVASLRSDARSLIPRLLALGADPAQQLPDGTRLSDDYSRIVDEGARRQLTSAQTCKTIEQAFGEPGPAGRPSARSGGLTL